MQFKDCIGNNLRVQSQMTDWTPTLDGRPGPKYRAIADSIADAIAGGDLQPGAKLPPQRNLAYDLGVTLGTVTRAYREIERRGLTSGEVGRGTYVRSPRERHSAQAVWQAATRMRLTEHGTLPYGGIYLPGYEQAMKATSASYLAPGIANLTGNLPHDGMFKALLGTAMKSLADSDRLTAVGNYHSPMGMSEHRIIGAEWIAGRGLDVPAERIAISAGCQAGMLLALLALTRPGDTIACERLGWPGVHTTCAALNLNIVTYDIDDGGGIPDDFERVCRDHNPRLAICMPTIHNPTSTVMSEDRRRRFARIAEAHDVFIMEDDVYGFLCEDAPPPISAFTTSHGIYVTSLSKAVSPGLRVGYVAAPPSMRDAIASALRATCVMTSTVAAEIASHIVTSGMAAESVRYQRAEAKHRQDMLRRILTGTDIETHPTSFHAWVRVPRGTPAAAVVQRLAQQNISVTPGQAFCVRKDDADSKDHIRVCICAIRERDQLEKALLTVRNALTDAPAVEEMAII